MDVQTEQKKDPSLRKVVSWIQNGCNDEITYSSFELKKYHEFYKALLFVIVLECQFANEKFFLRHQKFDASQLSRLQIQKNSVMRQFFDDVGKISHYQICIPKHLRKEVLYRIHKSPTSGHLGVVRTAEEFRRRFYFPGFFEFLTDYIRNCL